jgi:DNA invertase Pin-like site-specific DNA recombinase
LVICLMSSIGRTTTMASDLPAHGAGRSIQTSRLNTLYIYHVYESALLRALENFRSQGIEFVSLSEQVDTSTPTGKMIFTVLGAVAELERSLIAERVRAGIRNARAKGKRLGRPRSVVDAGEVTRLRAQGASWRAVGAALGVSAATALYASANGRLKNPPKAGALSDS